ncbi:hypothetical protein [Sediminibacterium ginsengisoli]|nr:hypothetical protein [Sediminibacterium ginsengisoli]
MPAVSYALTSGPSQPEMQAFTPVSASDMVDPFTGDFSYNIPLLDVDGYPVNLSYQADATLDDEASWVGLGWNITPGALNRQLRGLPDDFNGSDKVQKETDYRANITKGISVTMKGDFLGIPKGSPSLTVGVEYNNYRGIGTKLGFNTGISLGDIAATPLNTNNSSVSGVKKGDTSSLTSFGASFGLSSSSMNGASANVNFSVVRKQMDKANTELSLSAGFPYNSRAGLQGMTFGVGYNTTKTNKRNKEVRKNRDIFSSFTSFASPTYTPTIEVPATNLSFSASASLGPQAGPFFVGWGTTGYYNKQFIGEGDKIRTLNAYGLMYAEKGKDDAQALMDFNREKDIPYAAEVQYLPVPIPTNDLFVASSQAGGGQYKIARSGHGVFFDPSVSNNGMDGTIGVEFGAGLGWDGGADLFFQSSSNSTNKWKTNNRFLEVGDFSTQSRENTLKEKAYFKRIGEPVVVNDTYAARIGGDSTIAIGMDRYTVASHKSFRTKGNFGLETPVSSLERPEREPRNQPMSYLTAAEASLHAMNKIIPNYAMNKLIVGNCNTSSVGVVQRVGAYRKTNHISEVTVTGNDGSRTVYGIPVYNISQEEVTFNIKSDTTKRSTGLIGYSVPSYPASTWPRINAQLSGTRERHYSRQTLPAYATSYLLTAILSNDYIDVKGDGITDDDRGTAVKFNYHKLSYNYNWRTPYGSGMANYHEGMLSDKLDDKASYVYGTKELWYMHSIESKTMVAQFIIEDRLDGLGVNDVAGAVNTTGKLKRLKEIRLYSKSDIYAHTTGNVIDTAKLTPIKTVHFEYSYSLMPGMPNAVSNTGKLTLKKVYFTYGRNETGMLHPYSFEYNADSVAVTNFNHRQYDRWGVYKDAAANPGGLNNSEFPYTIQNKAVSDAFVARWQLKRINLPTGGSIDVQYEADDYAYVQNKRAMQMFKVRGIGSAGGNDANRWNMVNADEVYVDLPVPVSNANEFMSRYLDGEKFLFFKFFTKLDSAGHYEFVPGYARIKGARMINSTRVAIGVEKESVEGLDNPVNPMTHTAWQFLKSNLPKYAYPGYENLEGDGSDLKKLIESMAYTINNLKELMPNSYGRIALERRYGNSIDLNKSYVRLQSPDYKKIGGGLRVKTIQVNDAWKELSGVSDAKTAVYTQEYSYTKTIKDNQGNDLVISSGVASYEPILGGEENPFHQPIFYRSNVILQLDNYYYIEEPIAESLYPAPEVGYSRVSVRNIGSGETQSRTGEVIHEFYTAKDYPTKVDILPLDKTKTGTSKLISILLAKVVDNIGLSQGFRVENNDMHGKPKSMMVYNLAGAKIASTEYYYKTLNPNDENGKLDNRVRLLMPDATVKDGVIGKDIEVFSDMRESISKNEGYKAQVSFGGFGISWISIPFFFPGIGQNYQDRGYHSAATVKLIHTSAVLQKVRKMESGSYITTENMLWDGLTGDVLMTKTQNEYDDPVYNLNLPANWAYEAMGQSYKNDGTYLTGISTNANGEITNSLLFQFLHAGDEIGDLNSGQRYWVIYTLSHFSLIDRNGAPLASANIDGKILRTGTRNTLSAPLCSYVSLQNPIIGNKLNIQTATKILATEAQEYSQDWKVPQPGCLTCPEGYVSSDDGTYCQKDTTVTTSGSPIPCTTICAGDHDASYSSYGTRIFEPGYTTGGGGAYSVISYSNSFWISGSNCGICSEGSGIYGRSSGSQQLFETGPYKSAAKSLKSSSIRDSLSNLKTGSAAKISIQQDIGTGSCATTPTERANTYCGPLDRTGIWTCQGADGERNRLPYGKWIGFSKVVAVPATNTYYLGIASDNRFRFKIDGVTIVERTTDSVENFRYWNIYPITLTAGTHVINIEGFNTSYLASMGAEIYNNTATEIASATNYCGLNVIFSTKDMIGQQFNGGNESCPENYSLVTTATGSVCRSTVYLDKRYNPYVAGHLGNWRAKTSYAFHAERETVQGDPAVQLSTNTRYAGAYTDIVPFWQYVGGKWTATGAPYNNPGVISKWVQKNEVIAFDVKGSPIEERDPLNRYSSVLFGYMDSRPVAVSSNARYSELQYDGFEDYSFSLDCRANACTYNHFNIKQAFSSSIALDNAVAHSGYTSLRLSSTLSLTRNTTNKIPSGPQYTINNTTGMYLLNTATTWSHGFTPEPGKKYVISFWLKDASPRTATSNTTISVNGATMINNLMKWPVVEGWKRVEVPFVMPASDFFTFNINPSGTVWIDDMRIMPFDGQMKSYAYDPVSQRLMAEMDENNFATFYEYDNEGTLIRVKKETEKGIVTIKETRSSYRKQ